MTLSTTEQDPASREQTQVHTLSQTADIGSGDADAIVVQQTSGKSWLVRRVHVPNRAGSLLGCIEERDGIYEVMRVNDGFQWHIFTTLDDALDSLTQMAKSLQLPPSVGVL